MRSKQSDGLGGEPTLIETEIDDRELVRKIIEGSDVNAERALIRRWTPPIFGVLVNMLGDAHQAEDCVQETWISVFRSIEKYDPSREFRPWLFAIATNAALQAMRRPSVRKQPTNEVNLDTLLNDAISPLNTLERKETIVAVRKCIEQLGNEYQEIVDLYYGSGGELTLEIIAKTLSIPIGTIKTRIQSARRSVRRCLELAGFP